MHWVHPGHNRTLVQANKIDDPKLREQAEQMQQLMQRALAR